MKQLKLALAILVLILIASACSGKMGACGTLVKTCGPAEHIIMRGVKSLSQNVKGNIRYFKIWDCATEQWMHGSCSADCSLKIR